MMRHFFVVLAALLAISGCVQLVVGVRSGGTCVQTQGLVLLMLALMLWPVKPPRVEVVVPFDVARKDPNA